jgi:hypothetical protein
MSLGLICWPGCISSQAQAGMVASDRKRMTVITGRAEVAGANRIFHGAQVFMAPVRRFLAGLKKPFS